LRKADRAHIAGLQQRVRHRLGEVAPLRHRLPMRRNAGADYSDQIGIIETYARLDQRLGDLDVVAGEITQQRLWRVMDMGEALGAAATGIKPACTQKIEKNICRQLPFERRHPRIGPRHDIAEPVHDGGARLARIFQRNSLSLFEGGQGGRLGGGRHGSPK